MIEEGVEKDRKASLTSAILPGWLSLQELLVPSVPSENPCLIHLRVSTSAPDHCWSKVISQASTLLLWGWASTRARCCQFALESD